ncbi:hypothetical protein Cni_G11488 [Canna indica]|uniref:GRAM domain-containing protein n=1 Tax=Canna indica TaxID=4628 RepID=A0AAQ3K6Q8_9LILI|nr:hypothetical protein Cni_G11488 [Canna indica]
MGMVRDVLGNFGKRVNEAAKKTEDFAENFWQHYGLVDEDISKTLLIRMVKILSCIDEQKQEFVKLVEHLLSTVVIPLNQLRSVNPSASKAKPGEKYIQVVSIDSHEFWFMGFVNYDSAVKNLQEAVQPAHIQAQ